MVEFLVTPSVQFNETDFPFAFGFGSHVSKPSTSQNPQNSSTSSSSSGLNPLVSSFPFVSIPSRTALYQILLQQLVSLLLLFYFILQLLHLLVPIHPYIILILAHHYACPLHHLQLY
ncbi:hypothetical protein Pint_27568 [Pistacia integerrima]|uniref:Uncharacterized protein n=1 Tax=Pistacia integerrima TaxID=434235 RepID=A0ACC0YUW7_9ROSI|nr:hypothetical protein Pint_27568 [Pistacia integerrima]